MTALNVTSDVYTDFQGLEQLRNQAGNDAPTALKEVGKQFEAMFIQMMLKSMREAMPGDPLFGNKESKLYQDLFDKQISQDMAAKQSLGLADIIVKQLQKNAHLQQSATTDNSGVAASATQGSAINGGGKIGGGAYTTPSEFIKAVWPHAKQAAEQLGVDPQVLVAQSALETGWGQNIIHHADGRSSNNLFGIKAGNDWQKEVVTAPTLEYRDGVVAKDKATFRSYESLAASFQDYVKFLQNNPRYKEALMHAGNPQQYTEALQQGGYATDPSYAEKIQHILGGDALSAAFSELKADGEQPIG